MSKLSTFIAFINLEVYKSCGSFCTVDLPLRGKLFLSSNGNCTHINCTPAVHHSSRGGFKTPTLFTTELWRNSYIIHYIVKRIFQLRYTCLSLSPQVVQAYS